MSDTDPRDDSPEPTVPAEPTAPAEPTVPAEAAAPTEPVASTEPEAPTEAVTAAPTEPVAPTEATGPTEAMSVPADESPTGEIPVVASGRDFRDTAAFSPGTSQFPAAAAWSQSGQTPAAQMSDADLANYSDVGDDQQIGEKPKKKRRRPLMTAGIVAAVVLLLAVVGLGGTELYLRNKTVDCLSEQFTTALGTPTTVDISGRPVLLQYLDNEVQWVSIDTDDSQAGRDGIRLHGRADRVGQSADGMTLGALDAVITIPTAWLQQLTKQPQTGSPSTQQQAGAFTIDDISTLPDKESLVIKAKYPIIFGIAIDVEATIKLTVADGKLAFRVTDVSTPLSPFPIPASWADDAVQQLRPKIIPPALDALTISSLKWGMSDITATVTARDTTLPTGGQSGDQQQAQTQNQNGPSCSII